MVFAGVAGALVSLDTTVNIALPSITSGFGIGVGQAQWIVISYVLTYASLLLLTGRFADAVGHVRVLLTGLVTGAVAMVVCATASSFGWLLAGRVVQGVGAALVLGAAPALVTLAAADADRARALGVFQMAAAIGLAAGPPLGGILVNAWGWRAVFAFRAPASLLVLALAAGLASPRFRRGSAGGTGQATVCPGTARAASIGRVSNDIGAVPPVEHDAGPVSAAAPSAGAVSPAGADGRPVSAVEIGTSSAGPSAAHAMPARTRLQVSRLDLPGAVTFGAGAASLLLAISRARDLGWSSGVVVGGAVIGLAALMAWWSIELRSAHPVLDVRLFRSAAFSIANALNVAANGAQFAIWLLAPYYLLTVIGYRTVAGGAVLGSAPLAVAVAAFAAGRLDRRVGASALVCGGLAIEAVGLAAVSRLSAGSSTASIVSALALSGFGLGLFQVPNLSSVMGTLPRSAQGVAGALTQMMRTIGVISGVTFASLLFSERRDGHARRLHVPATDPATFVPAFRDVLGAVAAVAAVSAAVALLTRRLRIRGTAPPPAGEPQRSRKRFS